MPMGVAFGREPSAWVQAAGGAAADARGRRRARRARPRGGGGHRRAARRRARGGEVAGPADLRAAGLAAAGRAAAARLGRFWIHLDVDVLDEAAMPATDYLMPDGLEWDELAALMAPLGAAPGLAGLSLGCVNPEKDPGGRYAERTCELLAGALGRTAT